jgi:hypothetical protein
MEWGKVGGWTYIERMDDLQLAKKKKNERVNPYRIEKTEKYIYINEKLNIIWISPISIEFYFILFFY